MSEFYESENNCVRCLRSSPIASLLGFIVVLIGGGAFGGATIFARRYLIALLDAPNLPLYACKFPYLDYTVYGMVGAIGLFSLLAYVLCALSSGWNAKHCFESSRKSACGRCCNMTLIVLLVLAIVIWVAVACLMTYPVMSIAFLWHRNEGATRLRLSSMDLPTLVRPTRSVSSSMPESTDSDRSLALLAPASSSRSLVKHARQSSMADFEPPRDRPMDSVHGFYDEDAAASAVNSWSSIPNRADDLASMGQEHLAENIDSGQVPISADSLENLNEAAQSKGSEIVHNMTDSVRSALDDLSSSSATDLKEYGQGLLNKALSASESIAMFFKCSPDSIDLSYYGLYDAQGLPIYIARSNLEARTQNILICACIAIAGVFLLILGYLQIVICTAMNYARMQEARYYEASSEVGEEGVALQQ